MTQSKQGTVGSEEINRIAAQIRKLRDEIDVLIHDIMDDEISDSERNKLIKEKGQKTSVLQQLSLKLSKLRDQQNSHSSATVQPPSSSTPPPPPAAVPTLAQNPNPPRSTVVIVPQQADVQPTSSFILPPTTYEKHHPSKKVSEEGIDDFKQQFKEMVSNAVSNFLDHPAVQSIFPLLSAIKIACHLYLSQRAQYSKDSEDKQDDKPRPK